MVSGAALYGVPALLALWRPRGSMLEAAEIAAIGAAGLIVPMIHFYRLDGGNDLALAAVAIVSALLPAGAAAMGWRFELRGGRLSQRIAGDGRSALLVAAASALALPAWTLAPIVGLLGLGLLFLSSGATIRAIEISAWAFAGVGLCLLAAGFQAGEEIARVFGVHGDVDMAVALVRWAGLAAIFALFAWKAPAAYRARHSASRDRVAGLWRARPAAVWALRFLLCRRWDWLPTAYWSRALLADRLLPAMAALLGVTLCWAAAPLVDGSPPVWLRLSARQCS